MATDASNAKKKKKKGMSKSDKYFTAAIIALAVIVGGYLLATWDWPSHDPKDLVGQWYYDTSELNVGTAESYQTVTSTYWDFGADQSFSIASSGTGDSSAGTYAVDGETLTLTFGGSPEAFQFVIKGDTLLLGEGDDAIKLTRVK